MDIPFRPLSPEEALKVYADWLLGQRIEEPWLFFRCLANRTFLRSETL